MGSCLGVFILGSVVEFLETGMGLGTRWEIAHLVSVKWTKWTSSASSLKRVFELLFHRRYIRSASVRWRGKVYVV